MVERIGCITRAPADFSPQYSHLVIPVLLRDIDAYTLERDHINVHTRIVRRLSQGIFIFHFELKTPLII
jgi:hypothetical protein